MQSWYDDVRNIKLSYTNNYITVNRINDWFFACGSDYFTVKDKYETMSEYYVEFCNLLMDNFNNTTMVL
jgi:hypothetical protein